MLPSHAVTDVLAFEQTCTAYRDDFRLAGDGAGQRCALRERQEITLAPLGPGLIRLITGQHAACRLERSAPQRCVIHPERREEVDVSPLADVLGDLPSLVDADARPQRGGVESGLEADGPGTDHGDPTICQTFLVPVRHSALTPSVPLPSSVLGRSQRIPKAPDSRQLLSQRTRAQQDADA